MLLLDLLRWEWYSATTTLPTQGQGEVKLLPAFGRRDHRWRSRWLVLEQVLLYAVVGRFITDDFAPLDRLLGRQYDDLAPLVAFLFRPLDTEGLGFLLVGDHRLACDKALIVNSCATREFGSVRFTNTCTDNTPITACRDVPFWIASCALRPSSAPLVMRCPPCPSTSRVNTSSSGSVSAIERPDVRLYR